MMTQTTLYSDGAALKGDYTAQRQVIGEMEFGETRVLAEYTGTFWSLLDSKWSLKQTNVDNPLFELLGIRVVRSAVSTPKDSSCFDFVLPFNDEMLLLVLQVKFFSGRKLDYEPKHCAKRRSEEDFMTLVEFSKQHPYGKAVALLDLKFGSIEASVELLVLLGILLFFLVSLPCSSGSVIRHAGRGELAGFAGDCICFHTQYSSEERRIQWV